MSILDRRLKKKKLHLSQPVNLTLVLKNLSKLFVKFVGSVYLLSFYSGKKAPN